MAPFHLPAARDTAVADVDTTPADDDDAGSIAGDSYTSSDAAGPSSSAVAARRIRDPTPTITIEGMLTEPRRAKRNSEPEVGNMGIFFGNWGQRGTVVQGRKKRTTDTSDRQILKAPTQIVCLAEATREVEDALKSAAVAGNDNATGLEASPMFGRVHTANLRWITFKSECDGRTDVRLQQFPRSRAILPRLTVAAVPKGSYREQDVISLLDKHLEPWGRRRDWRIIWADGYSAHITQHVRNLAWSRGYIIMIHGGGATPVAQTSDTTLHEDVRREYGIIEAATVPGSSGNQNDLCRFDGKMQMSP